MCFFAPRGGVGGHECLSGLIVDDAPVFDKGAYIRIARIDYKQGLPGSSSALYVRRSIINALNRQAGIDEHAFERVHAKYMARTEPGT